LRAVTASGELAPRWQSLLERARAQNRPLAEGLVRGLQGIAVEVGGLRAAVGDLCVIHAAGGPVPAEVAGFHGDATVVMPLGAHSGIARLDRVTHEGRRLEVVTGDALLGRVVDALGRPLDGGPRLHGQPRAVTGTAPPALSRAPITRPFATGVRAIDAFLTCGRGQRIGIFAGSGVGKSTLLGSIARAGEADVNVIALIGERGREVRAFLDGVLGPDGLARSAVVVATSDEPPMLRLKGAFTAATIAEDFRAAGRNVLFLMDSATRFAGAAREVGLAIGEPPTLRGYPPSLFAELPRLVERLGSDERGTITAMLTVLVEGDDLNEPVSDALRGYLDGHIVLSRAIAARGRFPAVDVLQSVSRLMPEVTTREHRAAAAEVRALLAHYEENRDLVQVGAYRKGADPRLDRALDRIEDIESLLRQEGGGEAFDKTVGRLRQIAGVQ
jgi:flagellum-specific ATP synthase/type III secretion protein N (ATPase)